MEEQGFIESRDEMERLLCEEKIGYLGLALNGKPYVVPLNYHYAGGKIWIHCGFKGKKLDYLKRNPQACFVVARQAGWVREHGDGNPCHVDSDSVICYGKARVLDDMGEREIALNAFNRRFLPEATDIAPERVKNCCVVEIAISEMTGRQERERKRTCWRHSFSAFI
ncbi:MAG: pyridoxamine 5'-phosphate oxidase family protein [Thermodesulfobacteriota bacterium]